MTVNPLEELVAERVGARRAAPVRRGRSTWRCTTRARVLRAGRPGRPAGRLPHQPRGRAAVRRGGGPGPRRVVGASWAGPTRSWWSRPAPGRARWPAPCSRPAGLRAGAALRARRALGGAAGRARTLARADPAVVRARPPVDADGIERPASSGSGPSSSASASCRRSTGRSVVLANELLDNLAVPARSSAASDGWLEVRVGVDGDEVRARRGARAAPRTTRRGSSTALAPDAPTGRPGPGAATRPAAWLRRRARASPRAAAGWSCVDYADTHRRDLAARPPDEWLRTYARPRPRRPRRSTASGTQDITCEVGVDQLARVRPPSARPQPGRARCAPTASTTSSPRAAACGPSGPRVGDLDALARPQPGRRGRGPPRPRPASAPSASSSGTRDDLGRHASAARSHRIAAAERRSWRDTQHG